MIQSNVTRNLIIAGVAALSLIVTGCSHHYTGDNVIVQSKPVEITKDVENRFKDFTGLLLVDKDGKVTAITPSGKPIDLCGVKYGPNCEVELTAHAIVQSLRSLTTEADTQGRCFAAGRLRTCHVELQKYPYHTGSDHYSCNCQ